MSGPKLSEAELERLRQEQLERERQEALRKLMEARNVYNTACAEVKAVKAGVMQLLNQLNPLYRSAIENDIKRLLKEMDDSSFSSSDPEEYTVAAQKIRMNMDSWKSRISKVTKGAQDKAKNDTDFAKRNIDLQILSMKGLQGTGVVEPVKIDFSSKYDDQQIKMILQNVIGHFEGRIRLNAEPRLLSFDRSALQALRMMEKDTANLATVKAKVQQIINEEENQIRLLKEFDQVYDEYLAVSSILGIDPKDRAGISISQLKKELDILNAEYKRRDEMDYIADQINEVMVELGYSFVSSRVLKKKDAGETEYSLYQDSNQSGVAVYTDESGAVMMRMTVLGDGEDITDADREFSYQSQIAFCSRHDDLVEALAARGVYLSQKSYQAPDRKHTFKVKVSDTDSSTANNTKKVQKVNRRARRRGRNKRVRAL